MKRIITDIALALFLAAVVAVIVASSGCKRAADLEVRGVPEGVRLTCGGEAPYTATSTCIGDNGIVYTCVRRESVFACGARNNLPNAEAP